MTPKEKIAVADKQVEELNTYIHEKIKAIETEGITVAINPYWDLEDKNLLCMRVDTSLM